MVTGKVLSVNADNISGSVELDEASGGTNGSAIPFSDLNFPNTGLKANDPCSFDITEVIKHGVVFQTAVNLQPLSVGVEREINTIVNENQTVGAGETLVIRNGGVVKGNISINAGKLIVGQDGKVVGAIDVDGEGTIVVRQGGIVNGNISIKNGSVLKVVNSGTVKGNIDIVRGQRLIVGNDNGGGIIKGNVVIHSIRKVSITNDSVISAV